MVLMLAERYSEIDSFGFGNIFVIANLQVLSRKSSSWRQCLLTGVHPGPGHTFHVFEYLI